MMSSARTMDIDALDRINKEISETKATLRQRKIDSKKIKDNVVSNEWTNKSSHRTIDSLLEHAKSVGTPVVQYYNDLFNNENGDNYHMRKATTACNISDPMFLKSKENELPRLHNLINELVILSILDMKALLLSF